ncbi:MAG: hypothetical protein AAF960_15565 [Bacteroidota bacterium]
MSVIVQIRSADTLSWELAGQNYRMYYDASNMDFVSATSLLGDQYQALKLIQNAAHIDASDTNGTLAFEEDLGFLNFTIDLLNLTEASISVPNDGTWLSTAELFFTSSRLSSSENAEACLVWARFEKTAAYATSFVDISSRVGSNKAETIEGLHYFDCLTNEIGSKTFLKARVYLQAALERGSELMEDKLRVQNYLPIEEPYGALIASKNNFHYEHFNNNWKEKTTSTVLEVSGVNAIVDWLFLELRNKENYNQVVATRSALLQRDGDVVDMDGISKVAFDVEPAFYYVCIRHRNHLGVMTNQPILLNESPDIIDFSKPSTPIYGENARKQIDDKMALWGGNADSNEYIVFQGGGVALPDTDIMFFDMLQDKNNVNQSLNFISKGYSASDVNMDGRLIYQGGNNDIDELIFYNIITHPKNMTLFTNFYKKEQIPKLDKEQ